MATELTWTDTDRLAVDTARVLAADAVEKTGNGHPGTAISLAPLGYLLYHKVMSIDPSDPNWLGRDRFIMSAGHSSLTQYTQLYLAGLGLELSDLESLRTWGSLTPGHPEYGLTKFVETTTGPLGAGVANAVGMAMAARRERGLLDPDAAPGTSLFDHYIYAIAGDGCMQEGIASEASSLAGTQELGNLIMFYDDNRITIEGDTAIAFSENVEARYEAYGWHVQHVDFTNGGTTYEENVEALMEAIDNAKTVTDKPSFIRLTTVIGWPVWPRYTVRRLALRGSVPSRRSLALKTSRLPSTLRWCNRSALLSLSAARVCARSGTRSSPPGMTPTQTALPCSSGCSPTSCPTTSTFPLLSRAR